MMLYVHWNVDFLYLIDTVSLVRIYVIKVNFEPSPAHIHIITTTVYYRLSWSSYNITLKYHLVLRATSNVVRVLNRVIRNYSKLWKFRVVLIWTFEIRNYCELRGLPAHLTNSDRWDNTPDNRWSAWLSSHGVRCSRWKFNASAGSFYTRNRVI